MRILSKLYKLKLWNGFQVFKYQFHDPWHYGKYKIKTFTALKCGHLSTLFLTQKIKNWKVKTYLERDRRGERDLDLEREEDKR